MFCYLYFSKEGKSMEKWKAIQNLNSFQGILEL